MQDPASNTHLGHKPDIHRTASVRDTTFGIFNEIGARTKVAECSFGDYAYVVNDSDIIYTDVGKFCSIAAHTRINPGNHPTNRVAMSHFTYPGAGAVVTKDVAPWTIVVGNPARALRRRFADPVCEALDRIAWWNWPRDALRDAMPDFRALSAEAFIAKYVTRPALPPFPACQSELG